MTLAARLCAHYHGAPTTTVRGNRRVMRRWSAHLFRQRGLEQGLSPESILAAWAFVDQLQRAGLPPVLTLRHLAALTGTKYGLLRKVVSREAIRGQYRSFRVTKRSGGVRRIYVTTEQLARCHRWIHDNVLMVQPAHPRAFAFKKGTTVFDCANEHCGARWLVKFDVTNFFESFDEKRVYCLFQDMDFPSLLSFEFSRLLTVPTQYLTRRREPLVRSEVDFDEVPVDPYPRTSTGYTIHDYDFAERGVLGQGLCTSPATSNLLCLQLDAELAAIADGRGMTYTRYADDITFSSAREALSRQTIRELRTAVLRVLREQGLVENQKKFAVAGPGARRVVLGLLVDGDRPRLTRATRSRIDGHLRWLEQRGAVAHATARGFRSVDGLREHLTGLLAHVKQVDEELHARYMVRAARIRWPPP